ncbi:hypothetical protein V8G54_015998 [Vigna mungo]|uniref:Uncharacterized protein n=1 Tax=Vigna mungo TaxID=3915 RepID=A0AAQ3NN88_VIGMU
MDLFTTSFLIQHLSTRLENTRKREAVLLHPSHSHLPEVAKSLREMTFPATTNDFSRPSQRVMPRHPIEDSTRIFQARESPVKVYQRAAEKHMITSTQLQQPSMNLQSQRDIQSACTSPEKTSPYPRRKLQRTQLP